MSKAFMCDLCNVAFVNETDGLSDRVIASEDTEINSVPITISIRIVGDVFDNAKTTHICNPCWQILMQKVKAWVDSNI